MANVVFNQGLNELLVAGLPAMCDFLLSAKPCSGAGAHAAADTLAGGVGEIAGTGYARLSEARPAPVNGVLSFAVKSWVTGAATDWPAAVRSVVLVTTADNTGKAVCAWDLGASRDMSAPNTTENFTPTLTLLVGP